MSEAATWDDTSREDLRATLRHLVLGKVRLANSSHDDIVKICRDVYIVDECPENESEAFVQFATAELKKAETAHSKEQAGWLAETDCDRLDRVEAALRDRGILLWQVSPCCDTCTGGGLPDRIDVIESRHPGGSLWSPWGEPSRSQPLRSRLCQPARRTGRLRRRRETESGPLGEPGRE